MSNMKHANSFDFARISAALLVLYSHAFAIGGAPEPTIAGFCSLGSLGLFIFFSISGYLVSMSWLSDGSGVRFAIRRALRIFPALTVVILLSTFVLGPIVTTVPMQVYLHHPATYRYLANIGLYVSYYLPGSFEHVPIPNAVNGSLWSLPVEVLMYIILGGLGWTSLLRKRVFMIVFCGAVGVAAVYFLRSSALALPFLDRVISPHPAPILFLGMELHQVMLCSTLFLGRVPFLSLP
jgi:peptidoglycan/LPS O-acetylase OafA/YrhL